MRKVDGLLALPDGTLWFGCATALCRLRDGHLERFETDRGVPTARWDRLMHGSDGSLWARGGQHLLQLAPALIVLYRTTPVPVSRWTRRVFIHWSKMRSGVSSRRRAVHCCAGMASTGRVLMRPLAW